MTPTQWFLYRQQSTIVAAAARRDFPNSTIAEVWTPRDQVWVERDVLLELDTDTSWDNSTKAEVDAWIALNSAAGAPTPGGYSPPPS